MLIVRPFRLEFARALQLDVQDEFDGHEKLPPGFWPALGHVGSEGLVEVLDEALERELT